MCKEGHSKHQRVDCMIFNPVKMDRGTKDIIESDLMDNLVLDEPNGVI